MKTFNDLIFQTHPIEVIDGIATSFFPNGYGVSVIHGIIARSTDGTFEVAVLDCDGICYETHLTSDVIGHQTPHDVTAIMVQVQLLPTIEG